MKQVMFSISLALATLVSTGVRADWHGERSRLAGAVYTIDNAAAGNNVLVFGRRADGSLTDPATYPTQGKGTGGGLGNQGSVLLSRDGRWLFVCNAGSGDVSLFQVTADGLQFRDIASAGGQRPISLTLHRSLLYVLNAGGAEGLQDNLAGLVFAFGRLFPLPNSATALSQDNTGPAQIAFTSDGDTLVVTEKATGLIDTFTLADDGTVDGRQMYQSPAPPPFGFAAGRHNRLFVTEANGGAGNPGGGSVSSYELSDDGQLTAISTSVATKQTAACWLVLTRDQRFAYSANTPDNSISSFQVGYDGRLQLAKSQAGLTGAGSKPVDLALSEDNRFLYSLNSGNATIGVFWVHPSNGSLQPLSQGHIPTSMGASINGLAAR